MGFQKAFEIFYSINKEDPTAVERAVGEMEKEPGDWKKSHPVLSQYFEKLKNQTYLFRRERWQIG